MSLESTFLFKDLSERSQKEIAQIAAEESYSKGAFLFHADDSADSLFILQEGRVRLSVTRTGHLAHIISGTGEAIGWSSMVGNDSYTASAECLGPVKVTRLGQRDLNRILEQDPAGGITFFRRLAWMIGRRLAESYGAILSVQAPPDLHSWG
jgi:CRP-like cAMP-binding protein